MPCMPAIKRLPSPVSAVKDWQLTGQYNNRNIYILLNTKEIIGELLHENMLSSHIRLT